MHIETWYGTEPERENDPDRVWDEDEDGEEAEEDGDDEDGSKSKKEKDDEEEAEVDPLSGIWEADVVVPPWTDPSHLRLRLERDGVEVAVRCDCADEALRQRMLSEAGIPARYRHCTLEDFELWNPQDPTLGKARRAVQRFVDLWPEGAAEARWTGCGLH